MFSPLIGLHYAEAGGPVREAETRSLPEKLIVKRRLVEGDLFIRSSSLGQSANETFFRVHRSSAVIGLKSGFILLFPDDGLSGKRWIFFHYQNLPRSLLTNPPPINPRTFMIC